MVSTKSERVTIYNAFGIIRGSIEPGNAIYAAMGGSRKFCQRESNSDNVAFLYIGERGFNDHK